MNLRTGYAQKKSPLAFGIALSDDISQEAEEENGNTLSKIFTNCAIIFRDSDRNLDSFAERCSDTIRGTSSKKSAEATDLEQQLQQLASRTLLQMCHNLFNIISSTGIFFTQVMALEIRNYFMLHCYLLIVI